MSSVESQLDYIDVDVAYLIGLITARGELSDSGGIKRITIEFPFKNQVVEGVEKKIDQRDQILLSLDKVLDRVNELTDVNVKKEVGEHSVYLVFESLKNTLFWRNIKLLMKGRNTYYEFEVPDQIFKADEEIKKEFVRQKKLKTFTNVFKPSYSLHEMAIANLKRWFI